MRLLLVLMMALAATPCLAQAPAASMPAATIPSTVQFDLPSKITGRTYRIYVTKPLVPPPPEGYAVVYVLDAIVSFPIAAWRVRSSAAPAIVVGISYPDWAATSVLRSRDFTPYKWAGTSTLPQGLSAADHGGGDDFHRFMMEELRPVIAAANPVNVKNQSLIGYSLGGLFALHVLFKHPDAYQRVAILSPSIWFNNRQVLTEEADFVAAVRSGASTPKILITSGAWEQGEGDPSLPPPGPERDARLARSQYTRMIDNARELAERLSAVKGGPGYEVKYTVFPEETHGTVSAPAINRAMVFVLQR